MKEQLRTARTATLQRKGLADITNSPMPLKILKDDSNRCENITRDYVEKLMKENKELLKLIEERNKIIELSEGELQRLRISYQKSQLQNRSLAQTNSQMLAELNLTKDKLKALNHELGCKNALLKAKNQETQEKAVKNPENNASMDHEAAVSKGNDDKRKSICGNTRQQRSQSLGVSDINKQDDSADKEKTENKRRCVRRKSTRFISAEDVFEIEEVKSQLLQNLENSKQGLDSTAPDLSNNEDTAKNRSSIGRPLRRASVKVQSYKEPPLNIKMRRES